MAQAKSQSAAAKGLGVRRDAFVNILSNVMRVLGGSVIRKSVSFLALSSLVRLYEPEAFRQLRPCPAISGLLLLGAGFGYELAIVSAEPDDSASSLARLCSGINALLSVVLVIVAKSIEMILERLRKKGIESIWCARRLLVVLAIWVSIFIFRTHAEPRLT